MQFKMKEGFLFLCLLSLCILCGCRKTPDEVMERAKDYGENKQIKEDVEPIYCKPDELKNAGIADIDIDTGNIELPDKVDFSGVEDVCLLHMSYEKDFLSDKDRYLKLFGVNKDTFSERSDSGMLGVCENYDSKKAKKGFNISENGFISYYAGVTYDFIAGDNDEDEEEFQAAIEDEYDIDNDDLSGVKIVFGDKDVKILNICRKAEKWLEENMPMPKLEYHVSDAISRTIKYPENKKESTVLSLCAELEYNGIRLNNHITTSSDDTSDDVITKYDVNINYDASGNITFFSNGSGKIKVDSAESLEKIVDFKSAVKLVNKKMADFNKLKVERIIPLYAIYSTSNFENDEYISDPGKKVEARPVYAFLFDKREENEDIGISKEYENFVLVDMETGELTTDFGN